MRFVKLYIVSFLILVVLIIGIAFVFSYNPFKQESPDLGAYSGEGEGSSLGSEDVPDKDSDIIESQKQLSHAPETVKAIYLTSWSASKESRIDYLIDIAKTTEINAVVIDIKDYSGYVAYDTTVPEVEKYGAEQIRISDIDLLIQRLHAEEIYVIARITVFQDPVLARARPDLAVRSKTEAASLWLDNMGLAWIDPAAKESWDYNIAIARDAINQGFDEINFDYVRFPSDGNLQDMSFPFWDNNIPKHSIIREFFRHLRQELSAVKISVDLFGLSTISSNDLGIGQIIEDGFEYFDYVCPMVYPSHYADGFIGYQNPAEYPYEVIRYSMEGALRKLMLYKESQEVRAQLRPWLQDFNLGAVYDVQMVRAEIEAVYDALGDDFSGFMLWNSQNFYTIEALEPKI